LSHAWIVQSLVAALVLGAACGEDRAKGPPRLAPSHLVESPYRVRFDQVGYPSGGERFAVVVASGERAPRYRVIDAATERAVADGTAGPRVLDTTSRAGRPLTGDRIDLSKLRDGAYFVVLEDGSRAGPIAIGKNVYAPILPLVTRFLAEQRCGRTTMAESLHEACHLFASVRGGHSGDGVVAPGGPPVDVEGGWHDAGDYLKFVGTTAYVLAVELMALRDHGAALGASGEALARELRWGLDWLLKMVAGAEPYHQVGGEGDHETGWRLPDRDTEVPIRAYDARPVWHMSAPRGENLLGRSAAAFALGAQVYARDEAYASKLLTAAKATYDLARTRDAVQNPEPPDFYNEASGKDDRVLAAATLARVTGDRAYARDAHALGMRLAAPAGTAVGWGSLDALALLEAARAFPEGSREHAELADRLGALAAPIAATARSKVGPGAAFGYALPAFGNGSVAESLGAAATCLAARAVDRGAECDVVALRQVHWLFGANPFGLSFMVGAGHAWPTQLHHAIAQAAHVEIPGAIVGGPTSAGVLAEGKLPVPARSHPLAPWSTDDLLFEDDAGDYVCTEPAIDFAAALVFVLAETSEPR
jgi:hypothetical protein